MQAQHTLKLRGDQNVPAAIEIVGFVVSMPMFCDSGSVLQSPLNKTLARKAGVTLAGSAIAALVGRLPGFASRSR